MLSGIRTEEVFLEENGVFSPSEIDYLAPLAVSIFPPSAIHDFPVSSIQEMQSTEKEANTDIDRATTGLSSQKFRADRIVRIKRSRFSFEEITKIKEYIKDLSEEKREKLNGKELCKISLSLGIDIGKNMMAKLFQHFRKENIVPPLRTKTPCSKEIVRIKKHLKRLSEEKQKKLNGKELWIRSMSLGIDIGKGAAASLLRHFRKENIVPPLRTKTPCSKEIAKIKKYNTRSRG